MNNERPCKYCKKLLEDHKEVDPTIYDSEPDCKLSRFETIARKFLTMLPDITVYTPMDNLEYLELKHEEKERKTLQELQAASK